MIEIPLERNGAWWLRDTDVDSDDDGIETDDE